MPHIRALIIFFLIPKIGLSQFVLSKFNPDTLGKKSIISGQPIYTIKWKDKLGDNFIILTEGKEVNVDPMKAPATMNDDDVHKNKSLYAFHLVNGDSVLWKLTDFEKLCPFDVIAEFRDGSTRITDIDKNGIAETWIMYSTTCASDVSPRTLKLILHQGSNKYAIRGTSQPSTSMEDKEYGGKFVPDHSFQTLPKSFLKYAQELWSQYLYDY
ncbi:M949_RS01915 family surface polysaccharide biosynthesis protein [Flavihumibacter solisilvae]|uniref:Uncharacterized protein n=1 Tax=Flavihumibacter solisilvae TaxID=1349421 RepID=A0A0C1LBJ5_9BACT|nr:hypothetical protein [Flavihumibacter solisilvae]KIC92893.1 hypothetical protein OI18_21020 [Flavihumibacter solisilvae]